MLSGKFLYNRIFVFGLAGLAAFFVVVEAPAGIVFADSANLVPNPSVETQNPANTNVPLNWATDNWGTNKAAFTYQATGHTGSKSVKVQITSYTSGDAKWYYSPQAVTPGTKYNVSDWYQSNVVSRFVIEFVSTSGAYSYTELATAPASATWKQYTGTVTAPANAKTMTILHLLSRVGWLVTDDYSVTSATVAVTGSIKITKTAVNGNGTFNFMGSTGISAFSITTTGGTGSYTVANLTPGTYAITEGTLDTGWAQTSTTCGSVTVTAGNTATCSVTNTYTAPPPTAGSIKITKTAVNGNGTFNFTGSSGISAFSITTARGTGNYNVANLTPGTYTITEGTLGTGWAQTSTTCGSVTVTAGNTATCSVTNTYTAPGGTNVVPNPSLETVSGSAPASWNKESWGTNTSTFTYIATGGHTGTHSLKVQTTKYTDGDAKWYFNPIAVTSGDTYDFTDWYESDTLTHVVIDFANTDGTDYYLELRTAPAASTWTKYEESFQVPYLAKTMTFIFLCST